MSLMKIKSSEKKRNSKKCPYPYGGCKDNRKGMCCRECKVYEFCDNACLNKPDKCRKQEKEMTLEDFEVIAVIAIAMMALMIVFEGDQRMGRALKGALGNGSGKNYYDDTNGTTLYMCLE